MTISPDLTTDLLQALAWQLELGADEAIGEAPVDRFAESMAAPAPPPAAPSATATPRVADRAVQPPPAARPGSEPAGEEEFGEGESPAALAAAATTLEELAEAMRAFEGSPLKKGARSFVFCDMDIVLGSTKLDQGSACQLVICRWVG